MTDAQKNRITELKNNGFGYKKIARMTGISPDTVKSFCKRGNSTVNYEEHKCLNCGRPVQQKEGRKIKKFCSDKCRNRWWNAHQNNMKHEYVCTYCGRAFRAGKNRKYCCHDCYIADRFGDNNDEE